MIMTVSVGNILDITEGVIIQQVNAQGVMKSGIAKVIRDKWPVVWDEYSARVGPPYTQKNSGADLLGTVILTQVEPTVIVASIVGQQFYRRQTDPEGRLYTSYDALDKALTELASLLQGIEVCLHYPLLGSDRGGAHWPIVKAIVDHRLERFDHRLWLLPGVAEPT
jgi:O-acetyl-ADP-ribose deacetylase (regulator of RNase III)